MASFKYISFAGGEIAPALWGRVDQVKYATGLRTCKNFWVMRHGGLANRPGTAFLAEVKDSTEKVRLIPFVFNPSQTYVLEFGDQYMRVYRNGAQVMDGENPYEIATPYVEADLPGLQYVQSADVVTLVHPNYAPRELKRTGHTSWTLSTIAFGPSIAAPTGLASDSAGTTYYYKVTAVDAETGEESLPSSVAGSSSQTSTLTWEPVSASEEKNFEGEDWTVLYFRSSMGAETTSQNWQSFKQQSGGSKALSQVKGFFRNLGGSYEANIHCEIWSASKAAKIGNTVSLAGITIGSGEWLTFDFSGQSIDLEDDTEYWIKWYGAYDYALQIGALEQRFSTENKYANGQFDKTGDGADTGLGDLVFEVVFSGETAQAGTYNIYKLKNGRYGWIGVSDSASFTDNSFEPDLLDTPPVDRQPFAGIGNYPSTTSYYQQRRIFANTLNNPEGVWASRSGLPRNFMVSTPLQDDDAVTFSLVGRQVNEVRHLLEVGKLVAFTASGEYSIEGDPAGILVPGGVNPKQHTANGSGSLPPLVVDGSALYVQARGSVVRDLAFNFDTDGYRGNELSIFAAHLIDGYTIVDWAYQQIPHSIVWAVRDDGVLLGLTYIREHQVFGWHRHEFDGFVESVCVVPEGTEDALYLVVRRTIDGEEVRYVERMHTRQVDDIVDAVFLDCSLTYDGRNTGATTMTLSGGTTWTHGESLDLESSEAFFAESDIGNAIHLTLNGDTVRCAITAFTDDQNVTVNPHKTVPEGMRDAALATWSRAVDEVAGLDHLEGKAVSIFADGFVVANPNNPAYVERTVSGGTVSLDKPYAVIHVGLPITATMETLNIDSLQGPSLADKKKHVSKVTALVESSRGIWAGIDEDGLTEYKARNDEGYDDPVALTTGTVDINIQPEWNSTGKVMIRQVDPLPLSILSVIPSGFIAG